MISNDTLPYKNSVFLAGEDFYVDFHCESSFALIECAPQLGLMN